jgi:spermidine/putrescine-binding protein
MTQNRLSSRQADEAFRSLALSYQREEISRRQFLYRAGMLAGTVGLGVFLAACGVGGTQSGAPNSGGGSQPAGGGAGSSTILWAQESGIGDPTFLEGFKDAVVKTVQVVSEATMATQIASGQMQADVSIVSQGYAQNYVFPAGIVQVLDTGRLTHWNELDPYWQNLDLYHENGKVMAIPNIWGTDSVMYNTLKVSSVDSVAILFDPSLKGQIAMPENGVESIAIAGQYIGVKNPFWPTDSELAAIKQALLKQKPLVRTYWTTIGDLVNLMTTGDVTVAHGWLSVYTQALKAGIPLKWAIPKEGQIGFSNGNGIMKKTTNLDVAYKFMDYVISTDYLMPLYKKLGYRTTNKKLTDSLSPEERTALQLDNVQELLKTVVPWITPPADVGKKMDDLWAEVKAA